MTPLERWLRNAAQLTSVRPSYEKFFREMADEVAKAAGKSPPIDVGILPEKYIGDSSPLPIGFLAGASRTAASVARLIVPRYEDGEKTQFPGSKDSLEYFGTGWLIGPRHIISNRHVIDARSDGEAPPLPADFDLQWRGTKIQFDYDRDGVSGVVRNVVELAATGKQSLDYAILELDADSGRPPLTLRERPIELIDGIKLAVNIIQHPGGNPKQIAIRNNLVAGMKGNEIAYFTDTEKGSSGSPVCDDAWRVVALHKAGTRSWGKFSFQGKDTVWVNIGTLISEIIADVKANKPDLWPRIGAVLD